MANFITIPLKRNGTGYLLEDNYIYLKNRNGTNGSIFLRCMNRHKCHAAAKISGDRATITKPEHANECKRPNPSAMNFRHKVVTAAADPANARATTGDIYNHCYLDHVRETPGDPAEIANSVQSLQSLRTTLKDAKNSYLRAAPGTLAEVDRDYVAGLQITSDGMSFLQASALPNDPERFFMFANMSYARRIASSKTLFVDGTFWTAPGILRQLVTIHGEILGQVFPLAYFLLPRQTEVGYTKMWDTLKAVLAQVGLDLSGVERVVCDFEAGLISATKSALPHAVVQGCYFHVAQAIYRNVDVAAYRNEVEYKQKIRMIIALGHVPAAHKATALQAIRPELDQDPRVTHFLDTYFIPNWLNGRDLSLWDWYNVERCTNNNCESFHSALNKYFKHPHLSFYKFVLVLGEEEKLVEKKVVNRLSGFPLPPKNAEYERLDARVRTIQAEFAIRTYHDYMLGLSYCVPDARF